MRKNSYTQEVDRITAPDRAVEKMLSTARNFDKKEKIIDMKSFNYKGVIAASLAVVTAVGGIIGFNSFNGSRDSFISENSFVITANAEEIGVEKSAVVSIPDNYGLCYSENEDGRIEYQLDLSFECKGDNISSITYSVDKDAIGVICRKDNDPVIQGKPTENITYSLHTVTYTEEDQRAIDDAMEKEYKDTLENPAVEQIMDMYERKVYTSVTLDYNNQNPDGFTLGIVGVSDDDVTAHKDEIFIGRDTSRLESKKEWLGKLVGNIVHCTVTFEDGTVQTQDIVIDTTISTYSNEHPVEFNGLPDDIKDIKDYTGVFVTYSLAS